MKRRDFITLVESAVAMPLAARAQQPTSTIRRIGILFPESASAARGLLEAFRLSFRIAYLRKVTIQLLDAWEFYYDQAGG
jgi:hypothetical protein